ncbi:MAG: hypothetical protein Tsb0017_18190 [Geothermobacteraceae bacterium]
MPEPKARTFLTTEEKARIEQAVRQVEATTSGEIVPLIVDASYDYPRSELIGAGCFATALAALLCWLAASDSVLVFVPLQLVLFLLFRMLIRVLPALKRRLIPQAEIDAEVEERAITAFVEHGLHETRDRTGILILISLFERRVFVLADRGINDKVPQGTWDEVVAMITEGLRQGSACDSICNAIARCGELLAKDFPRRADDTDELPNLIID